MESGEIGRLAGLSGDVVERVRGRRGRVPPDRTVPLNRRHGGLPLGASRPTRVGAELRSRELRR
jgi:hypothetical protein